MSTMMAPWAMKRNFSPQQVEKIISRMVEVKGKRSYQAAQMNRLTSDWAMSILSADAEIRTDLKRLRARCRELEREDDYARKYFKLIENNVVGHTGIKLQMEIREPDPQGPIGTMRFDLAANDKVEAGWQAWGKVGVCTADRQKSWTDSLNMISRTLARDGSILIRKLSPWPNKFNFAIQLLESDHLDHDYECGLLPNGNTVRMGIESDQFGAPVAYYLLTAHPGDLFYPSAVSAIRRIRIPASEIIHVFTPERPGQSQGVPWLVSSMKRLHMLAGYEEAELVAARTAACKGGFYEHETPEGYQGDDKDERQLLQEMEPGQFEDLPIGTTFKEYDPKHPNQAYPDFIKGNLRGAAAGLGVSYNSLGNDIESVNFSSIRAGLLEEREEWKKIQQFIIDHVCDPIFEAWLPNAMLTGQVELPFAKLQKFQPRKWKARRWPWVDPLKDAQANDLMVAKGFTSRRRVIADAGNDISDIDREQAEDKRSAEENGLDYSGLAPVLVPDDPPEGDDPAKPTVPAKAKSKRPLSKA